MLKGGATLPKFSPTIPSTMHFSGDDKRASKRSNAPLPSSSSSYLPSNLRKIFTPLPSPRVSALVLLVIVTLYILLGRSTDKIIKPFKGEPRNWGDYVGQGLARAKLLSETPVRYADLGDRWSAGTGPFYRSRNNVLDPVKGDGYVLKLGDSSGQDSQFETERRGVLGGASTEWSSGVVGMGDWLGGVVDMRKGFSTLSVDESIQATPARAGLAAHILSNGWTYKDAEDEANTEAFLREARVNKFMATLPLRDRVRGDALASKKAAEMWSSIYGALEGESTKSALEVAVERLVRRVPVVIFSKTTCP